jgi:murein DD-endopeptidase MepM/ murein hydrolase activator NlpD
LPGTATISAWPGNGSSRGSFVTVDSTNYTIIYQHLDSMLVSNGSSVAAGQIIGKMGSTGGGTGVHLHIEVYDKITKKYINYPSIP